MENRLNFLVILLYNYKGKSIRDSMIINKEVLTCADLDGKPYNVLCVSYVNSDGKIMFLQQRIPEEQMFNWRYTTPSTADPIWKSYDNKCIRKVPSKFLSEFRMNEILCSYGDSISHIHDMNVPITFFCDIETDSRDGFPKPEDASSEINTIALTRFPNTYVFGHKVLSEKQKESIQKKLDGYSELTKGYTFRYIYYETEYEMMKAFVNFIKEIPALTGWNFLGYDWLYIYNRCKKLNIDLSCLSPSGKFTNLKISNSKMSVDVQVPMHRIIYDYLFVYNKWDKSVAIKENNTLDFVAEQVLGIKKVQHNMSFAEFYDNYFEDYVFYNAVDTILVEQIDKKINTAKIWFMMTSELKIELNMAFSTIKPTEIVVTNFIYPQHKVIPMRNKEDMPEGGDYEGAFVWPSFPGIYKMVGSLDFASLYPSIMRQFQISPESYRFNDLTGAYKPKSNEIKTSSGAVYVKDPNAIVPAMCTEYYARRKAAKNQRKQCDQEMEDLIKVYHRRLKNAAG